MNVGSITPAAIVTVLTNAVAVAVAFGVPLTHGQQDALLIFAGSVSSLVFAIYATVHVKHVASAVTLATTVPAPSAATTPAALPPSPQAVGPSA